MTVVDAVEVAVCDLRLAGSRLVVAVSGGPDSVALLRALHELRRRYQLELIVGHFNHRWRGERSDGDALFVSDLAKSLRLPVRIGVTELPLDSANQTEEFARQARYAFLESVARSEQADAVVTAHHRDDNIETILFHLLRGTSWRGLAGIPRDRSETHEVRIVRPLLALRRDELHAWLREIGQMWRTDETNQSLDYTRNRLRTNVIPELAGIHPRFDESLLRLAAQALDIHAELARQAERVLDEAIIPLGGKTPAPQSAPASSLQLRRGVLAGTALVIRRESMVQLWRRFRLPMVAMGMEHWDRLARLVETTGDLDLPGGIRCQVTSGRMFLTFDARQRQSNA